MLFECCVQAHDLAGRAVGRVAGPVSQGILLLPLRTLDKSVVVGNLQVDQSHADRQHPKDNKRRDKKRAAC